MVYDLYDPIGMYILNEKKETNPILHPIKYLRLTMQIRKVFRRLDKSLEDLAQKE